MDKRLQEIYDNYDKMLIGLDDAFAFRCKGCGKCCTNREDIMLSASDMYRLSKALGLSPGAVVKRYCDVYIGHDSRIPITRLNPVGKYRQCPLLANGKCSVHYAKPAVCAMYPIGRAIRFSQDTAEGDEPVDLDQEFKTEYILNPVDCGDKKTLQTVRQWLKSFSIPEEDAAFHIWQRMILKGSTAARAMEKSFSEKEMKFFWDTAFVLMYLNYDTAKPFLPQLQENSSAFMDLIDKFQIPAV